MSSLSSNLFHNSHSDFGKHFHMLFDTFFKQLQNSVFSICKANEPCDLILNFPGYVLVLHADSLVYTFAETKEEAGCSVHLLLSAGEVKVLAAPLEGSYSTQDWR